MFGYIRPLQGELKVREYERFRACYCGLCHALGKKYGLISRFILNYELVFLSMLLWDENEPIEIKRKRCIASPLKKRRCCCGNTSLDLCAGYTVILTWWKLRDTIADERFIRTIPHRFVSFILSGAYKKASREFSEFDKNVRNEITNLQQYETDGEKSLDGAADKFARMLCAAVPCGWTDRKTRPMSQLLYHLGRWVYIIDACDDYKGDVKSGRHNPIVKLYPPQSGSLPDDGADRLKTTLSHSNNLICSAFELLPENPWTSIIDNMVYMGMPYVCEQVFREKWKTRRIKRNEFDI